MEHPHGEAYINWGWGSDWQWVVIGHFPHTSGVGESIWFTTGNETYPPPSNYPIQIPFDPATEQHRYVHYCLVHDSAGFTKAYKDFSLVGEQAEPVVVHAGTAALARHWWTGGSVTRFTGVIDEVRVYNRALTEDEISDLEVYAFSGFYPPVENPPEFNGAQAGQAIPIKWRVTDHQGYPVNDLESVSMSAVGMACTLGDTPDEVEEYTAGKSGLQNLGDGYYQWNWKTPKSYRNSCKILKLQLGDGIEHEALFRFRRLAPCLSWP